MAIKKEKIKYKLNTLNKREADTDQNGKKEWNKNTFESPVDNIFF